MDCTTAHSMKPFVALLFLFFQLSTNNVPQADIVDDLALHFKTGNTKEIAKNFAPTVDLIIIDQEDVYSKVQAEQILKDFFAKNVPLRSSVVHRLSNNPNYRYGIISLHTRNQKFRVNITLMKKLPNTYLITELRIEQDKQ